MVMMNSGNQTGKESHVLGLPTVTFGINYLNLKEQSTKVSIGLKGTCSFVISSDPRSYQGNSHFAMHGCVEAVVTD